MQQKHVRQMSEKYVCVSNQLNTINNNKNHRALTVPYVVRYMRLSQHYIATKSIYVTNNNFEMIMKN